MRATTTNDSVNIVGLIGSSCKKWCTWLWLFSKLIVSQWNHSGATRYEHTQTVCFFHVPTPNTLAETKEKENKKWTAQQRTEDGKEMTQRTLLIHNAFDMSFGVRFSLLSFCCCCCWPEIVIVLCFVSAPILTFFFWFRCFDSAHLLNEVSCFWMFVWLKLWCLLRTDLFARALNDS